MSKLYVNPTGLFPFQSRMAAYGVLRPGTLAVADQGLGKSHIAMAVMAVLFEDDLIDRVILVCEQNKMDEWQADMAQFTRMSTALYYGPKREIDPAAQVILSTYKTWSTSLVNSDPDDPKTLTSTELLMDFIGQRVLIVYDEMALLGTSTSSLQYRANELAIQAWRKAAAVRVLGLTGTPMSTSPECFWNLGHLIRPEAVGTWPEFCRDHVTAFNKWGRPSKFKNLELLERKLGCFMLRKRKTDPDVIDQFPKTVEKAVYLTLPAAHMKAYLSFDAFCSELPPARTLPAFQALNAFVCHPRSILNVGWTAAQEWIDGYGREKIAKLTPKKSRSVIGYVSPIAKANESGVIIFSNSVSALECLAEDIDALPEAERFSYVHFHGGRSDRQNSEAKEAFRRGDVRVMLASSKAERGINLPEAGYIVNYGIPTTHSSYLQRAGRASRLGSNVEGTVIVKSFIARGTIERATVSLWLRRNEWSDRLQDPLALTDENFTSAFTRQAMLMVARMDGTDEEMAVA